MLQYRTLPLKRTTLLCIFFFFLFPTLINAQYKKQALQYIEKLSSQKFAGRGYVNDGHIKASSYIEQKLQSLGYQTSFQNFIFPVVIYPGKIEVSLNNKKLVSGKDYVVTAGSPNINGQFPVHAVSRKCFLDSKTRDSILIATKGSFLLITTFSSNDTGKKVIDSLAKVIRLLHKAPSNQITGLIIHDTSQTKWGISQSFYNYPIIELNKKGDFTKCTNISLNVEAELLPKCQSRNVIGIIKGTVYPDSFIVLTSHYDHIGKMGKKALFPGANDNASGVAMMLCLAEYYAKHSQKYSIACIAFSAEEVGLIGSKFFVENPVIPLKQFTFMIHFDMIGTGEEGLKVVNGSELKRQFNFLKNINDSLKLLPKVQPRVQGCISDQCYFYRHGVPCFFVYTMGGTKAYHDIYDKPKGLSLYSFDNLAELSKLFIARIQE